MPDGGIKESNPALLQALAADRAFNDGAAAGLEMKAAMTCVSVVFDAAPLLSVRRNLRL